MKRRPPQSALARSTDGGSGRLSTVSNSTPPPCWTGRGGRMWVQNRARWPRILRQMVVVSLDDLKEVRRGASFMAENNSAQARIVDRPMKEAGRNVGCHAELSRFQDNSPNLARSCVFVPSSSSCKRSCAGLNWKASERPWTSGEALVHFPRSVWEIVWEPPTMFASSETRSNHNSSIGCGIPTIARRSPGAVKHGA